MIEERIGRLEEELREALTIASVEGEDFTAEMVARVQAVDERGLVRRFSGELDKRHRLVGAQGIRRLGRRRLSLYRFRHNLFQRYLYNNLDGVERAYLHEDVGNVLEALYSDQAEEITVQLARHFQEAGIAEKAIEYLVQAGERARRQYANEEAIVHFQGASVLLEDIPVDGSAQDWRRELVLQLHEGLGDVLELTGQHDEARAAYQRALAEAPEQEVIRQARLRRKIGNTYSIQHRHDDALRAWDEAETALGQEPFEAKIQWWQEWVQIQLDRLWAYYLQNRVQEISQLVEKSRSLVEKYGTPSQRAAFFVRLVLLAYRRDRFVVSQDTLAHARTALAAS